MFWIPRQVQSATVAFGAGPSTLPNKSPLFEVGTMYTVSIIVDSASNRITTFVNGQPVIDTVTANSKDYTNTALPYDDPNSHPSYLSWTLGGMKVYPPAPKSGWRMVTSDGGIPAGGTPGSFKLYGLAVYHYPLGDYDRNNIEMYQRNIPNVVSLNTTVPALFNQQVSAAQAATTLAAQKAATRRTKNTAILASLKFPTAGLQMFLDASDPWATGDELERPTDGPLEVGRGSRDHDARGMPGRVGG
jgi:hypothetical protein